MYLKMSSGKWRPSCLGLNVLKVHTNKNAFVLHSQNAAMILQKQTLMKFESKGKFLFTKLNFDRNVNFNYYC